MLTTSGNPRFWAALRVSSKGGRPEWEGEGKETSSASRSQSQSAFQLQQWVPLVLLVVRTSESLWPTVLESLGFALVDLAQMTIPILAFWYHET